MTVLGWVALLLGGLGVALWASTRTVRHARALAETTRIPPFFLGITLLAIGTDLPEIANSIIACATGHGDLNAGDSIGSAVTQATLVLGLLPLAAGAFTYRPKRVVVISLVTIAALGLGAWRMADGMLSSADGLVLLLAWVGGSALLWTQLSPADPVQPAVSGSRVRQAALILLFLALVGAGASAAVLALTRLSVMLGVPEYLLAFFASSLGTSLPELIVDVSAIRAGLKDMALGDVLGSSFVDTSLSLGIGPVFFPAAVTTGVVLHGSATAAAGIALMALVMVAVRGRHTWFSGLLLVGIYVGLYLALLR